MGKEQTATCKRMNLYLTSYMKINSNWIRDQNVKVQTIKLIEENMSKSW